MSKTDQILTFAQLCETAHAAGCALMFAGERFSGPDWDVLAPTLRRDFEAEVRFYLEKPDRAPIDWWRRRIPDITAAQADYMAQPPIERARRLLVRDTVRSLAPFAIEIGF